MAFQTGSGRLDVFEFFEFGTLGDADGEIDILVGIGADAVRALSFDARRNQAKCFCGHGLTFRKDFSVNL